MGSRPVREPLEGVPHRREYVRQDDCLPLYYEVLEEGAPGKEPEPWETLFDEVEPSPEENPKLYELLFDINQKLNILINSMTERGSFNMPEAREVNISGGGIRFVSPTPFKVGERLFVKTFLPVHSHVIRVNCEVVRSAARDGGGYDIAVKYIDIDEATREKIIRYIFSRQRKLLRNVKESKKP